MFSYNDLIWESIEVFNLMQDLGFGFGCLTWWPHRKLVIQLKIVILSVQSYYYI